MKKTLLVVNCIILAIGNCGAPLLMRLYFIKGGKRIWLSSWLETGGWPIIFIPLIISYIFRRTKHADGAGDGDGGGGASKKTTLIFMTPPIFILTAVIGILTGLDDYLYAYGSSKLPVSTSALIISTQLAFTAFWAFLLVKQKFTPYSVNTVVLLTIGASVLALHASGDRPKGETNTDYVKGFIMTSAASALYGFVLPLVEYMYKKANQAITYTLVLEIQIVMSFFATLFCTIGMFINKDFQAIPREAREFELEGKYYTVLICSAILWQFFFLGAIGVISCASSLLSGIIIAVLLPVVESLAVLFYHEKFEGTKAVSLALSLWAFVSYFYGEMKYQKKDIQTPKIKGDSGYEPESAIQLL